MIKPTINIRWKRLNTEAILKQLQTITLQNLRELKIPIQAVIERNVGTQYFSLEALKHLNHPYRSGMSKSNPGRGSGRPGGLPRGVINRQSGDFYHSIVTRGPIIVGDKVTITVYSRGDKIKGDWLLQGTRRMIGRPWTSHLRHELYAVLDPLITKLMKTMRLRVKV